MAALLLLYHEGPIRDLVTQSRLAGPRNYDVITYMGHYTVCVIWMGRPWIIISMWFHHNAPPPPHSLQYSKNVKNV